MTNAHTPGPWIIERGDSTTNFIYDNLGEDGYLGTLAMVEHGDIAQLEANTRLIASAPDLLQALRDLTDRYERKGPKDDPQDVYIVSACRAAIARATGEA